MKLYAIFYYVLLANALIYLRKPQGEAPNITAEELSNIVKTIRQDLATGIT